jgi:hypothetical protein
VRGLLAAAVLSLAACASPDPELPCEAWPPSSDPGRYCAAHRDAVLRFVRIPEDPEARRARLEWFRKFYAAVEKTRRDEVITQAVMAFEKEMPNWVRIYDQEHFWASRDTHIASDELRASLILGGFRHAMVVLERELAPKTP